MAENLVSVRGCYVSGHILGDPGQQDSGQRSGKERQEGLRDQLLPARSPPESGGQP